MPAPAISVCALQFAPVWNDRAGALQRLEQALAPLSGVDLVLVPELAITGYLSPTGDADLRPYVEERDGPTAQAYAALAQRFGIALAAPLAERDGERCYNSLLLFDEAGRAIGHWRKRHPWFPERWATPGDLGTSAVEWRGWRVTAAICYDMHFLARESAAELTAADVLLFPSAWVERPPETRVPRLRALAKRFDLTVVNANWARSQPEVYGQGRSIILGPDGAALAEADDSEPGAVQARLAPR
jgi:predicted amidohydrolase